MINEIEMVGSGVQWCDNECVMLSEMRTKLKRLNEVLMGIKLLDFSKDIILSNVVGIDNTMLSRDDIESLVEKHKEMRS